MVFTEVRDKIEACMSGWAEQYLSQAGKKVFVKAMAMALPNFAMSCFKFPIGVCRDVERAIQNYWCDIIDSSSNSWRADVISDGFNRDDVLPILSIPLSQSSLGDRLVWHHTTNGVYSVKTRYGLAVKLMEDGALRRKGRGAPKGSDFLESWGNFCAQVKDKDNTDEICQDFAFDLWRLWKNRNEVVFNRVHRQPLEILEAWRKSTAEYRASLARDSVEYCFRSPKTIKGMGRTCGKWQKPRYGTIKINTDASWCKCTLRVGVGWLGCDFAEMLQATGGSGIGYCHSAAAAEALAIRAALVTCIDYGFDDVIIESDARTIILMWKKEVAIDFSIECILGDINVLAKKLASVSFAFVPREGNRAAHLVAKYVFKEGRYFTWDRIGPAFLFNFLAQDVNISIRL
ncbi:hypothetical protein ACFX15_006626 [Malus domestica]